MKEINLHVAINRVSKGSKQRRKEYATEVRIISMHNRITSHRSSIHTDI